MSDTDCTRNYRLLIEYDGADFCGWQLQNDARTVQGCLEKALKPLFEDAPRVVGAGRTDSGVHARRMTAHFHSLKERAEKVVMNSLNANLPRDVRVLEVRKETPAFHARFDAKWRAYEYKILRRQLAIGRQYGWYVSDELPIDRLQRLAQEIIGDHCFLSFAHKRPDEKSYRSRIYRSEWHRRNDDLIYRIDGIRFLHGMVRLLVGTMLDIVRGSMQASSLQQIIAEEDVRCAGTKAPAHGLTLTDVGYSEWPNR